MPVVMVEHDPDWCGYQSLYPSAAELADLQRRRDAVAAERSAWAATEAAIVAWRGDGGSSGAVKAITYRMAFPTEAARTLFLTRALACQFRPNAAGPRAASPAGEDARVELARDTAMDAATIHQVERWLMAEAGRVGGRYVGWTAPAAQQTVAVRLTA